MKKGARQHRSIPSDRRAAPAAPSTAPAEIRQDSLGSRLFRGRSRTHILLLLCLPSCHIRLFIISTEQRLGVAPGLFCLGFSRNQWASLQLLLLAWEECGHWNRQTQGP